jgi:hypothetical protein
MYWHQRPALREPLLVDPLSTIDSAQQKLETLRHFFEEQPGDRESSDVARKERRKLAEIFQEVGSPRVP